MRLPDRLVLGAERIGRVIHRHRGNDTILALALQLHR